MIWFALEPCVHSRCESGYAAGPCTTLPLMSNREPWQGHSNSWSAGVQATEQPRWEQLTAKTLTAPAAFLATQPPKATLPGALSPPPSFITNPVSGGETNLVASMLARSLIDLSSGIVTSLVWVWPWG